MSGVTRPRVLVDLDPVVYETAVAHLLRQADVDEVVLASSAGRNGRFDIAVVDRDRPEVDAEVVIHLPGTSTAGEEIVVEIVRTGGAVRRVRPVDLLRYLDDIRPGPRPRSTGDH